jgi:hypothetical protein
MTSADVYKNVALECLCPKILNARENMEKVRILKCGN